MNKQECINALECLCGHTVNPGQDVKRSCEILRRLIDKHYDKKPRQPKAQYAVYDNDDELLCIGNVNECCDDLEITKEMFYNALHTTRCNQFKKARKYTILRLEDEEDA